MAIDLCHFYVAILLQNSVAKKYLQKLKFDAKKCFFNCLSFYSSPSITRKMTNILGTFIYQSKFHVQPLYTIVKVYQPG